MLNFVKKAFRKCFVVLLWINLIGSVIGMAIWGFVVTVIPGSPVEDGIVWKIVCPVAGLIIGAIAGILTNVFFGGLIAIFLDIGSDIANIKAANAKIEADVANIKTSSAGTSAVFQQMANRQTSAANAGGKA